MKATSLSMSGILLSCSLLLAAFDPVSVPAATTIETVVVTGASPIGFFGRSSLALDSSQKPHISFVDEPNLTVMYGVKSGGSWAFEAISAQGYDSIYGDPNLITSIALDSAGDPHIAFWDPEPNVLKYASKSGAV